MKQKYIDALKKAQQALEKEGIDQFNDKSKSAESIAEGLQKYNASRKLLNRIGDLQQKFNSKCQ